MYHAETRTDGCYKPCAWMSSPLSMSGTMIETGKTPVRSRTFSMEQKACVHGGIGLNDCSLNTAAAHGTRATNE